jgi:hypothetical protein
MKVRHAIVIVLSFALAASTFGVMAAAPASAANVSRWYFTNRLVGGVAEYEGDFGSSADGDFYVGDWNGDGFDDLARRNGSEFKLLDLVDASERTVAFGRADDEIFVGDFDGDGIDTLALRRGNRFTVRNDLGSSGRDSEIAFGRAADEIFVGDFDGNGTDTFAVRRGNVFYVRNSVSTGAADIVFGYGRAGDQILIGDWNGTRVDTFAVRRANQIFVRNDFRTAPAHFSFGFGSSTDALFPGDWNGDGVDTFAVRRALTGVNALPAPTPSAGETQSAEAHSHALLNQLRGAAGLSGLTVDPTLTQFARNWSATMAATGFSHSGGPYGENIAYIGSPNSGVQEAAATFHQMWADSAGHYANMVNAGYTRVGIGFFRNGSGWWATHVFT